MQVLTMIKKIAKKVAKVTLLSHLSYLDTHGVGAIIYLGYNVT